VLRANIAPALIGPPVLLGQGGADTVISPVGQERYVQGMCAAGQDVDFRVYDGFGHVDLMEEDSPLIPDLLAWTHARFDGEADADGDTAGDADADAAASATCTDAEQ